MMNTDHHQHQRGIPCDQCGRHTTSGWTGTTHAFAPLFSAPHRALFLCDTCRWRLTRQLHGLA